MSNLVLYKATELAISRYHLTEQETKLIAYSVSKLNPTLEGTKEERTIYIPYDEYAHIMGMDKELARKNLNNSVKELVKRVVEVQNKSGKYSRELFHWVNVARFNRETQSVELVFSEEIQPYLFQLKSFIKYRLDHVKFFENRHSIRVYEWLLSELKAQRQKVIRIELEEFKFMLMLENKYKLFKKLNQEVLKKIVDDINRFSNMRLELKTHGRPVKILIWEVDYDLSKETRPTDHLLRKEGEAIFEAAFMPIEDASGDEDMDFHTFAENYRTENAIPAPKRKRMSKDERLYRCFQTLLTEHNGQKIALSAAEHKFTLSMLKHYEKKGGTYQNLTDKQSAFLDGIMTKYKPKPQKTTGK